jgi:hypothetical protein
VIHKFTEGPVDLRQSEETYINEDLSSLSVFMLFFSLNFAAVGRRDRYYHQYFDTLDEGRFLLLDMTMQEMHLFLPVIVQMGHDRRDRLKDCWSTLEQFCMAFYRNTMKQDRFFHIPRFLHFSDNRNEPTEAG